MIVVFEVVQEHGAEIHSGLLFPCLVIVLVCDWMDNVQLLLEGLPYFHTPFLA
jgi:hypothetical protein